MFDLEGVMLSDYLLLQCISKGDLADVYRARQNGDGNYEVAVKVYHSAYAQQESFRNYFMAEAEKIGQFDHPNILPFLEFGEGEGLLYVITPFVAPGTLEDLLVRVGGRFSAMQTLPIMQQLCSAVQYAHNHDVIHGNIKPTNIFVAADGRMLLSDFGIFPASSLSAASYDSSGNPAWGAGKVWTGWRPALTYDGSQQSLARVDRAVAEYAAPEQAEGALRRASDIYVLGVLLFRILTGHLPFTGETPVEILLKHVRQPPPSARTLVPNISDAVDEIIRMAMQKRSDDRFASAEELSNAFLAAVSVAPVASPVASRPVVLLSPQPVSYQPLPVNSAKNPQTPVLALEAKTSMGKAPFWSVDPDGVEWSPIANTPPHEVNAVPLTAGTYLRNEPALPEGLPARPPAVTAASAPTRPDFTCPPGRIADAVTASFAQAGHKEKEVASNDSNRFNKGLRKALPIVVVVLLLLGLLGALLSSFFFPSDGHGAYARPLHRAQYTVVTCTPCINETWGVSSRHKRGIAKTWRNVFQALPY